MRKLLNSTLPLAVLCGLSSLSVAANDTSDNKAELERLTREVTPLRKAASAVEGNIARGMKYTLYPSSKTNGYTNGGDMTDLTDGKTPDSASGFWFCKGGVFWSRAKYIEMTFDLTKPQSVDRLKLFTGSGRAGVELPNKIDICGSLDGKKFYQIADLVAISKVLPPIPRVGYHPFVYEGKFSPVTARYIRLRLCPTGEYFGLTEVEIFKSSASGKSLTSLKPVVSQAAFIDLAKKASITVAAKHHMFKLMKEMPAKSHKKLEQIIRTWEFTGNPRKFKGVYPYSDMQVKFFAENAALLRASGTTEMDFAITDFYQNISPIEIPYTKAKVIKQVLQNGEKRGAAVTFINPGRKSVPVSAKLKGVKGELFNTAFVDSEFYHVTSTALFPHKQFNAIPGLTYQIAMTFAPEGLKPGKHKGSLEITCGSNVKEIPIELEILPGQFPKRPKLNTSGWEYLDLMSPTAKTCWQGTPAELFDSFRKMRNASLCFGTVGMSIREKALQAGAMKTDAQGNLLEIPDLKHFEDWVSQNPDAGYYGLVMLGLPRKGSTFGTSKLKPGTPEFNKAVTAWAKVWNARILKLGLKGKVFMQFFDEPDDEAQYKNIQMWHTAFRKGAPDIPVAITPCWSYKPEWNKFFTNNEILIPEVELLQITDEASKKRVAAFRELQKKGHVFHVYTCSFGPYLGEPGAFRNQAWLGFIWNAVSSNFWCATNMNEEFSFNRYTSNGQYFSPFFISDGKIISSKHDTALRDGIQDYEYLVRCRELIKKAEAKGANVKSIKNRFDALVKEIAAPRAKFQGVGTNMAVKAEAARLKVIDMIRKLEKM